MNIRTLYTTIICDKYYCSFWKCVSNKFWKNLIVNVLSLVSFQNLYNQIANSIMNVRTALLDHLTNVLFLGVANRSYWINSISTLGSRKNGCHFPDNISTCIFLNGGICISLKISLKFVPKFRVNNIPSLVLIMAWRWPGDKPLYEPMVGNALTYICVTRPQWVKNQSITKHDISKRSNGIS